MDLDPVKVRRELSALAQAAGFWNERTKLGIEMAVLHEDRKHIQFFLDTFQGVLLQDDSKFHPLLPDPEFQEVSNGEISFGKLVTGSEVLNPIQNFLQHTLIAGPSGTGKSFFLRILISQLIKKGICCHIWDTQSEYSDLAQQFDSTKLDLLDFRDLRVNPFDPPREMTQKDWVLGSLTNTFRESLFWRERTTQLFRGIVLKLFESGIEHLTPSIFVSRYEDLVHPKSVKFQSEFASLQRLAMMLRSVECFQCDKGEQVQDQLQRSRIVDIRQAPDDVRKFLIADSVAKHFLSRECVPILVGN